MRNIEKKIRIQLFSEDFDMLSDRLVTQDIELRNGPKETHKGPLKIEVCLFEQYDVDNFIAYLKRVQGDIPLEEKAPKKRKALAVTPENVRLSVIGELKEAETTKDFQETMEDYNFIPISIGLLKDLDYPVKIKEEHEDFTFWVRRTKKAKNPANHRYDVALLVGILKSDIVIYDGTEIAESLKLEDAGKKLQKIPKFIKLKFPHYIAQDERNRMRFEIDALNEDDALEPSKFYKRWAWDVQKVNKGIKIPRIDEIDNPYD